MGKDGWVKEYCHSSIDFNVDLSIIWKIVTENLPETKPQIAEMLEHFDE